MNPRCSRCGAKTWIIFDRRSWCRGHFLQEVESREVARREAEQSPDSASVKSAAGG